MLRKRIPAPPELENTIPQPPTPEESYVQQIPEPYEDDENTLSELIQMTPTGSPQKPSEEIDQLKLDASPNAKPVKLGLRERIELAKVVLKPCNSGLKTVTNIVAIDCEMVACGGERRKLARCSIVNYDGHV